MSSLSGQFVDENHSSQSNQGEANDEVKLVAHVSNAPQTSNFDGVDSDLSHSAEMSLSKLQRGLFNYGCQHYRRRCKIRAPCCNEVFSCRHCHNDAKNSDDVAEKERHDIPRHKVETVICSLCETEQLVKQVCEKCGVRMGEYFCKICKFFDDQVDRLQYHCNDCGICRIGGRDKYFHCMRCGCCYTKTLEEQGHTCVENSMHHDCPVCLTYLFDSIRDIMVMPCGHTMHLDCLLEMKRHAQYSCPICSKSVCDMSTVWAALDVEIAATPMPSEYRNMKVCILCNDCGARSHVTYHVVAQKCLQCNSYNTRRVNEM